MKQAGKGSTLALKPRANITRSAKQGYQLPHKNTDNLRKIVKIVKKISWVMLWVKYAKK